MPADLLGYMTEDDLIDLVEYLTGSPFIDGLAAGGWRLDAEGMLAIKHPQRFVAAGQLRFDCVIYGDGKAGLPLVPASVLFALLTHRDQLEDIRRDGALVPLAIEELLRWEPAIPFIPRLATRDVTIAEIDIPAGARVTLCLGAANRRLEEI